MLMDASCCSMPRPEGAIAGKAGDVFRWLSPVVWRRALRHFASELRVMRQRWSTTGLSGCLSSIACRSVSCTGFRASFTGSFQESRARLMCASPSAGRMKLPAQVDAETLSPQRTKHPRRAAVVSLYFSYGHSSHMIALARLLHELGYEVAFILDEKYLPFADFSALGEVVAARDAYVNPHSRPFDLAIFYNCATKNPSLVRALRQRGTTVFYTFHTPEPAWSLRFFIAEGWKNTLRHWISSCFSICTIRRSSGVIVYSSCAQALYEQHYRKHNRLVHAIPLLFDDEIGDERMEQVRRGKRYFGFVGTACKSHGFDAFVAFAKYAAAKSSDLRFLIATRLDLTSALAADAELARLVSQGKIQLEHGRVFSNEEINRHYLNCFCVWNAYLRSTQSGVVPRAFMAGTSVLASRVGSFPEYIRAGVNGEFVDSGDDPASILEVVKRMRTQSENYVDACRKTFKETFYYRANLHRFAEIVASARTEVRNETFRIDVGIRQGVSGILPPES